MAACAWPSRWRRTHFSGGQFSGPCLTLWRARRPAGVIYRLVHSPALGQYLTIPTRRVQFQSFPSARLVLLGEIGQQCVAASSEATESTEYLIWRVTHHRRRIEPTPFSQFCALLYGLLRDEAKLETTDVEQIKLAERFASAYEGVRPFGHGVEVAESFGTIDSFLCRYYRSPCHSSPAAGLG